MGERIWGRRADPVVQLVSGFVIVLLSLLVGGWIALNHSNITSHNIRQWTPTASASVGALALLFSGITYARSTRRSRQALTYNAWGIWSDETRMQRRQTRDRHPELTEETSSQLALLTGRPLASTATDDERKLAEDAHRISLYLGGMERFGAGWQRGLYDVAELDALGHTIIIKLYRRHEQYVLAIRRSKSQPTAYAGFQALAKELSKRHPEV